MSAAEQMYFTGAPLAHVAAYDERNRLANIMRRSQQAARRRIR